jgi:hypothetical protein
MTECVSAVVGTWPVIAATFPASVLGNPLSPFVMTKVENVTTTTKAGSAFAMAGPGFAMTGSAVAVAKAVLGF